MLLHILSVILISTTISTTATFEKGGGGFIDKNVGNYVKDGVASGVERDTYFETKYYTTDK